MTTIRGAFDGKAIIPDEPVNLPLNRPLTVQVETRDEKIGAGSAADLANSALFGLWADRTDIGDSLEYARRLRREGENRRHQIDDPA